VEVAGSWQRLLVVKNNDLAREWATKFRQGDPAYETDERWWEAVVQQDAQIQTGTAQPGPAQPSGGAFPTPNPQPPTPQPFSPAPTPAPTPTPSPARTEMVALSRDYSDDHSHRRFTVKAYAVKAADPVLGGEQNGWIVKANANGDQEFYCHPEHQVFQSVTFTPLDALLATLAAKAADAQRPNGNVISSLTALRVRYATDYELNEQVLVAEANRVLSDVATSVSRNVDQQAARALFGEIPQSQQEAIHTKMLASRVSDPLEVISKGRFLEFARKPYIVTFVTEHPELFFDGKYWDVPYETLNWGDNPNATEAARTDLINTYAGWLDDAAWLSESEGTALSTRTSRDRLLRALMSLRLLGESLATAEAT
jgi:hypothetical protein